MSFVGLILQALISILLIAGIAYGLRLHRQLEALKGGQADFIQAVADLDRAAARAEAGLASLRQSTEVAQEELSDRLDSARKLVTRLETAASDAAITLKRLEAAQRHAPARDLSSLSRGDGEILPRRAAGPAPEAEPPLAPSALSRGPLPASGRPPSEEKATPPTGGSERLRRIAELLRAPELTADRGRR